VAGSSVRTAVLDNLWLADLTQMQATYAQCPEGRPGWFPVSVDRADAQLNTWRAVSIAHGSCNYEQSGKLCAMDLQWIRNGLYQCTCIHAFACTVVVRTKRYHGCRLCTGCCSVPPWRRTLPSSRIWILVRVWTGMRPGCPGAVHSVTGVGR
jgi:hypothetical protein